jgi:predicted membrane metal-binding protein
MRAVCMFIFGQLCFMRYFPVKTTHVVLLTACLFLVYNPYYLLFADFQLSFGLTFALAAFLEYTRMNAAMAQQQSIAS